MSPGSAILCNPSGILLVGNTLYIADKGNNRIRVLDPGTKQITTLAGNGNSTSKDGPGAQASFDYPYDVAVRGTTLYVSDRKGCRIREIDLGATMVSTLAGVGCCYKDGLAKNAKFGSPAGVAVDSSGKKVYVSEIGNQLIRMIYW